MHLKTVHTRESTAKPRCSNSQGWHIIWQLHSLAIPQIHELQCSISETALCACPVLILIITLCQLLEAKDVTSRQGTNAHAILTHCNGASHAVGAQAYTAAAQWQRRRLWYAPLQHVLLQRANCRASTVQMAALLTRAHLACMWDHRVTGLCPLQSPQLLLLPSEQTTGSKYEPLHATVGNTKPSQCRPRIWSVLCFVGVDHCC